MPAFIIHHQGAFNVFSTVVDAPYYDSALTLDQLREELPAAGDFDERVARALATGCSALSGMSLVDCIDVNRAGPDETRIPVDLFIRKFLTLCATGSACDQPNPKADWHEANPGATPHQVRDARAMGYANHEGASA